MKRSPSVENPRSLLRRVAQWLPDLLNAAPSSLSRLRTLIYVCLAFGIVSYTLLMSSLMDNIAVRLGPQVRDDLEWRAERGASELADAADIGILVKDPEIIQATFAAHIDSDDVLALIAVDQGNTVITQHGKAPAPLSVLFAGEEMEVREGPGYLVSWANSKVEGRVFGRVAVVVSTRRLERAELLLSRASHITWFAGLAAMAFGTLVVWFFTHTVALRDARLADYAQNLEQMVEARTRELDERNRGMRLVLDNVAQGFITTGTDDVMAPERSAVVDTWFGVPKPKTPLSAYLGAQAPRFGQWLKAGLDQLRDGFLPAELALDQLPKRLVAGSRTFDVSYTPIGNTENVTRLLVIISDITVQLERERAEQSQRELAAIFQRWTLDRQGVEQFVAESDRLVAELSPHQSSAVQKRLLHTLKGNCAFYGIESMVRLTHALESGLEEELTTLGEEECARIAGAWRKSMQRLRPLLDSTRQDVVELEHHELRAFAERVREGAPSSELLATLAAWEHEPVQHCFERLANQAASLAQRLGKPEPTVVIQADGIRLDALRWSPFWSGMTHVMRNAVDHGLEAPAARRLADKPEAGRIELSAAREGKQLVIAVRDDGAGVDFDSVREKAVALGLPHATKEDLTAALFADGFSTRTAVDELSGRGVGLSALKHAVLSLGGKIRVESTRGQGAAFAFIFDDPALQVAA